MGYICPNPDPFNGFQKAALIEFSNDVREVFDFNDNSNTAEVQLGIERMTHLRQTTCTATAFRYARDVMLKTNKGLS